MNGKTNKKKIQHLLIKHLLEEGSIELMLPDGMLLELGITQEGLSGNLEKVNDYCWVIASQDDRAISIDSYNLGLRFYEKDDKIVFDCDSLDDGGEKVKILDVV